MLIGTGASNCSYRCISLNTGKLITAVKLIKKDWDEETIKLSEKLVDDKAKIGENVGLEELFLSDNVAIDDFMTTNDDPMDEVNIENAINDEIAADNGVIDEAMDKEGV